MPHNDGTSPILITFIGRRAQRILQAGLASTLEKKLQNSVSIIEAGDEEFEALADLFPAVPARAAVQVAQFHAAAP